MWTWELQTGMDGTQCLRVQISPEIPPTEAHSMLLNLTQLLCQPEEPEYPPESDSPNDSESNEFWFGRMNQKPWDYPNSN